MLEWEVKLHVDAMREIIKHLDGCHHLGHVIHEIHVFITRIRSAYSV